MTIEAAQDIFDELTRAGEEELKLAVFDSAIRYAQLRVEWAQSAPEQRREMGATRTRAHNAFIDACNILSRAQSRSGGISKWRTPLGHDRKHLGDFACFIHLFLALSAR